jgi:hypothetical protein
MDSKVEDKMVRQIEKNLSNNINENLFLTGRIFEQDTKEIQNTMMNRSDTSLQTTENPANYSVASYDYTNQPSSILSRAEYIRQARESCLRQMSALQSGTATYNNIYPDADPQSAELLGRRKAKVMKLFHEDAGNEKMHREENTPQEIASFRFLVVRTVCAVLLFLTIFILNKFDITIGVLTPDVVKEYVTGNDTLQEIENIMVTWLK